MTPAQITAVKQAIAADPGTGTAGSPANLGFEGKIGYAEISAIRNAP